MFQKKITKAALSGSETPSAAGVTSNLGASRSPGVEIGSTVYDYQTNGSIGRAIVYKDGSAFSGIHVDWMCLPCDESEERHIKYNASSDGGVNWAWETGTDGGKKISADNGGYCTIDVTHTGAAVAAWHHGAVSTSYAIRADDDSWPPFGYFDEVDGAPNPPNCEGWETGGNELDGQYIWPRVEYDLCDADTVYHVIGTEYNVDAEGNGVSPKTMAYYRRVNHEWPTCATAIDSEYCSSGIVRQDPTSNEIAIVWTGKLTPMSPTTLLAERSRLLWLRIWHTLRSRHCTTRVAYCM
jgi:hypothetical protein